MRHMVWALTPHPVERERVLAGLGDVARGHLLDRGGTGAVYVTRDRGASWEDLGLRLPSAVRVLAAHADK
ncbi:MAG TPA: hypothetical protein VFB73_15220 [Chloroflexota bacterium]|jgi:photosystem II stability/assembly factor-like uncharacterized protein|nr:hypothetical protein [Chloroflexota bacterium]